MQPCHHANSSCSSLSGLSVVCHSGGKEFYVFDRSALCDSCLLFSYYACFDPRVTHDWRHRYSCLHHSGPSPQMASSVSMFAGTVTRTWTVKPAGSGPAGARVELNHNTITGHHEVAIDGLVVPGSSGTALRHGMIAYVVGGVSFTI